MFSVPVNLSCDWVGASPWRHDILAPPAPVPAPGLSMDLPSMQVWAVPTMAKFAPKVLHKAQPIILDGHDVGSLVVHVTVPPANALLPVHLVFSSRTTAFFAMSVEAEGTAVACSSLPIFPMKDCGDPRPNLFVFPFTNLSNTVFVGMTPMDVWMALGKLAADLVVEALITNGGFKAIKRLRKAFSGKAAKIMSKRAQKIALDKAVRKDVSSEYFKPPSFFRAREALRKFVPTNKKAAAKWAVGQVVGNVNDNVRNWVSPNPEKNADRSVKVGMGNKVLGVEASYTWQTDDRAPGVAEKRPKFDLRGTVGGVDDTFLPPQSSGKPPPQNLTPGS